MGYRGYYTLKCKASGIVDSVWVDWINAGRYSFDVIETNGIYFEENEVEGKGSIKFDCFIDEEEAEIDWDTLDEDLDEIEVSITIYDESQDELDYEDLEFVLMIYDNDGVEHKSNKLF